MKITLVAGARPNFMKIAPIIRAILDAQQHGKPIGYRLIHTGQHYDEKLSRVFFDELEIPEPHLNLGVGSGSQAEQTAKIMIAFEKELLDNPPDIVVVVGDVTSTMACTVVAKKLLIRVAHVEGGIRSFDMTMPEEINRMVTDAITDYFFTTSEHANRNLLKEGKEATQIYFVGNTMIDTLVYNLHRVKRPAMWETHGIKEKKYFLVTLHRPSNVDHAEKLIHILKNLEENAGDCPIIFPVHPRTYKILESIGWKSEKLIILEPLSYLEFIFLIQHARGVITDSGGIQEETTFLHVPCITLRANTERPETIQLGTNTLVGDDFEKLKEAMERMHSGKWKRGNVPPKWDGTAAVKIVEILLSLN